MLMQTAKEENITSGLGWWIITEFFLQKDTNFYILTWVSDITIEHVAIREAAHAGTSRVS